MRSRRTSIIAVLAGAALAACGTDRALVTPDPEATQDAQVTGTDTRPATPGASTEPSVTPVATAAVEQELLSRWNAVATAVSPTLDFRWSDFEQFPHPTYKGGTAAAYQAFAAVLLAFFQQDDNFDFLARNHLFTLHLVYVFPNGANGLDTTFEALTTFFASPGSFGDIPADTRAALQAFADRMRTQ